MDSEKRNDNHNGQNENNGRHYQRPKRRRLRWGRLFLFLADVHEKEKPPVFISVNDKIKLKAC